MEPCNYSEYARRHLLCSESTQFRAKYSLIKSAFARHRFVSNVLQPLARSLSQPDLCSDHDDSLQILTKLLIADEPVDSVQDSTCLDEPSEFIPVPKPRKNKNKSNNGENEVYDSNSNEDILNQNSGDTDSWTSLRNKVITHTSICQYVELPTIKESSKIKGKPSFKNFLKINKITPNKFLSLRLKLDSPASKKKLPIFTGEGFKPQRPNRAAPPPPIMIFRPAAPPPDEDGDYEKAQYFSNETSEIGDEDTISELYHDAFHLEPISDAIYCTVDEANQNDPVNSNVNDCSDDQFGYDDDDECIYEEVPSSEETIYEEYSSDENIYDNADVALPDRKQLTNQEKKHLKKLDKIEKRMKMFNWSGEEVPVNAAIVKQDHKGSKSDLFVQKGEVVLILRMENNPPGKWLAKNERSKIGYVHLDNVQFDAESVKAVIKSLHPSP